MNTIIQREQHDVILIQETSKQIHNIYPKSYLAIEYNGTRNEQAGILYNISNLMHATSVHPNQDLRTIRDIMVGQNKQANAYKLCARMHAVVLEIKGTNAKIFCVSYHVPYKKKDIQSRLSIVEALLKLLNEYQEKAPLPIILGGDFNVNIKINLQKRFFSKTQKEQSLRMAMG